VEQQEKSFGMLRKIEKLMLAFVRAAAIGCIGVLPLLAWLPAAFLTRTGLGGHAEHFIAYLGTAIVVGLAFQESLRLMVLSVMLMVYAAALEGGQLYIAGRHASFHDLAFSAAGILIGGLLLLIARPIVSGSGNLIRQQCTSRLFGKER
jgi:VanZ family protein